MTMTDIPNWSASSKLSMEDGIQDSGYPWNFPDKNQASQVENESIMTCEKNNPLANDSHHKHHIDNFKHSTT
jgi:hypothetical protein